MNTRIIASIALALSMASPAVFAQSGNTGGVSGGTSGASGISGGIGSDFAASNISGAATENDGGLAVALDAAFGDDINKDKTKKAPAKGPAGK